MTNKTADELKKLIAFYGQAGLNQLSILWKQVVDEQLEAVKLPDAIKRHLSNSKSKTATNSKEIFWSVLSGLVQLHPTASQPRSGSMLTSFLKIDCQH
jgi:hypothetical protein